jgi:hypothetical protein
VQNGVNQIVKQGRKREVRKRRIVTAQKIIMEIEKI